MNKKLPKTLFPWFGGKRRHVNIIKERFGDIKVLSEPFTGSAALSLSYVTEDNPPYFILNDVDGLLINFWRAMKYDLEGVLNLVDFPKHTSEQTARDVYIRQHPLDLGYIEANPEYYDLKLAAYWVYGACTWVGGGWSTEKGPWSIDEEGRLNKTKLGSGISRKQVTNGNKGILGISRKQVTHRNQGILGISRKQVKANNSGILYSEQDYLEQISKVLFNSDILCGDWSIAVKNSYLKRTKGEIGVLLDHPYVECGDSAKKRCYSIYDTTIAGNVRKWCIENGKDKRICLCGYDEHEEMKDHGWDPVILKPSNGYTRKQETKDRQKLETLWFSPSCIKPETTEIEEKIMDDEEEFLREME